MSKQPKEKSTHLQELEAVFDRRTRRFSPFAVLGLNRPEKDSVDAEAEGDGAGGKDPPTSMWVPPTHMPHPPTAKKSRTKTTSCSDADAGCPRCDTAQSPTGEKGTAGAELPQQSSVYREASLYRARGLYADL